MQNHEQVCLVAGLSVGCDEIFLTMRTQAAEIKTRKLCAQALETCRQEREREQAERESEQQREREFRERESS